MHRIGLVALGIGSSLACGADPAPLDELTPVDPSTQGTPAVPEAPVDEGPAGLPAPVAEALSTVFPRARRVRCEVPAGLPEVGDLALLSLAQGEAWGLAPAISGGWFAGVVPSDQGAAALLRGDVVVGLVRWKDAAAGAWRGCTVELPTRFTILGLVEDAAGNPVSGATVHGCDGSETTANEAGRFSLEGYVGHACGLVAWVDGADGLGRSDVHVVASEGAEAIVEIQLGEPRLSGTQLEEATKRLAQLTDVQLRNGVGAEFDGLERITTGVELSPEARAVVDGWKADLAARRGRLEALRDGLATGTKEALLAAWRAER